VSSRLVENVAICAGSRVDVGVRKGLSYPSTAEVFFFKCDCTLVTWLLWFDGMVSSSVGYRQGSFVELGNGRLILSL
jgi:hypothetical protein